MYYAFVFRGLETIILFSEYFSSEHDLCSFQIALKIFRKFAIDTRIKLPLFKGVVTDWSWVFINGILFEWNSGMNIQQDLNLLEFFDERVKITILLFLLSNFCTLFFYTSKLFVCYTRHYYLLSTGQSSAID